MLKRENIIHAYACAFIALSLKNRQKSTFNLIPFCANSKVSYTSLHFQLIFKRPSILFSLIALLIYIVTNSVQWFPFLYICTGTCYF